MQLKTILNRVQKFKRFIFGEISWAQDSSEPQINVRVQARTNSWAQCSVCKRDCAGYDTLAERRYEFIPFWGIRVFLVYTPRRVSCEKCGVRVEHVPWAAGKHRLTMAYGWYLARWAKRMSWKEVAESFHTSWHHVFCSVEMAVNWGLEHREVSQVAVRAREIRRNKVVRPTMVGRWIVLVIAKNSVYASYTSPPAAGS